MNGELISLLKEYGFEESHEKVYITKEGQEPQDLNAGEIIDLIKQNDSSTHLQLILKGKKAQSVNDVFNILHDFYEGYKLKQKLGMDTQNSGTFIF